MADPTQILTERLQAATRRRDRYLAFASEAESEMRSCAIALQALDSDGLSDEDAVAEVARRLDGE